MAGSGDEHCATTARILVDLSLATRWELGLNDAAGRHVAGFKGVGPGSRALGANTLAPGTYF